MIYNYNWLISRRASAPLDYSIICFLLLCALSSLLLGITFKGDEFTHEVLIHIHDSSIVIELSTIVLGAEDCYQLFIFAEEAVTIFHHLVTTANQV